MAKRAGYWNTNFSANRTWREIVFVLLIHSAVAVVSGTTAPVLSFTVPIIVAVDS